MKVICEICSEVIGVTESARLSLPLRGSMFASPDPAHGYPPPFDPSVEYEFMFCPHGRGTHRPFVLQDRILTDEGYVVITQLGVDDPVMLPPGDLQLLLDRANKGIERQVRASLEEKPQEEPDISDEDAEKIARAAISKGEPVTINGKPNILPEAAVDVFMCTICGKVFSDKRRLHMHGMSHRPRKDAI